MILFKDWTILTYIILGVSLILIYLFLYLLPKEKQEEVQSKNKGEQERRLKLLLEMYRTFIKEVHRRGNLSIVTGTIFISAAFLILVGATRTDNPTAGYLLVFVSLLVYATWLFGIQYTGKRLDDLSYNRIRAIEAEIQEIPEEFKVYSCIKKKTECAFWLKFRRMTWLLLLVILFVGGLFLLVMF